MWTSRQVEKVSTPDVRRFTGILRKRRVAKLQQLAIVSRGLVSLSPDLGLQSKRATFCAGQAPIFTAA
jgi:hypothetical protein